MNLAELFARDPRDHSDEDVKAIIKALREARGKFIVDGSKNAGKLAGPQTAVARLDLGIKL